MWRRAPQRPAVGLLLFALTLVIPLRPALAGASPRPQVAPAAIRFSADEKLFTLVAWMNWVADEDDDDATLLAFPLRQEVKNRLKTLPPALRATHRAAYDRYLDGASLYTKNGLLLGERRFYGPPPTFTLRLPTASYTGPGQAAIRLASQRDLPSGDLLRDFYRAAGIGALWKAKGRPETQRVIDHFAPDVRRMLQQTNDLLRMAPAAPVDFQVNLCGYFGVSGQTTYAPWDGRYLIQINPNPKGDSYHEMANRQVFRHEYAHALLNDAIAANAGLIDPALQRVGKALGFSVLPPQELVAQCLEWVDGSPEEVANVFFYNRDVLFYHFLAKLPDFRRSGLTMAAYLPTLFRSFDPDAEITRWRRIEAEKRAAGEL